MFSVYKLKIHSHTGFRVVTLASLHLRAQFSGATYVRKIAGLIHETFFYISVDFKPIVCLQQIFVNETLLFKLTPLNLRILNALFYFL